MKNIVSLLLILIIFSCTPDSGESAVTEQDYETTEVYMGEIDGESFKLNELNVSLFLGDNWNWLTEKTTDKSKYFFKHSSLENTTLYLSVINQKEKDFAKNLTRLSKTYEHLLKKYMHVEESIKRIHEKKSYYLKFGFYNDKLNEQMISQVYNIQINKNKMITLTFSMPEEISETESKNNENLIVKSKI